jgi:hypothetical protein
MSTQGGFQFKLTPSPHGFVFKIIGPDQTTGMFLTTIEAQELRTLLNTALGPKNVIIKPTGIQ